MTASSLRWPLFALIGLMVAVGVAVLATQMVSEKIGITSEPVSAGSSLSPQHAVQRGKGSQHKSGAVVAVTVTQATSVRSGNPGGSSAESEPGSSDAVPSGASSDGSKGSKSGDD